MKSAVEQLAFGVGPSLVAVSKKKVDEKQKNQKNQENEEKKAKN